MKPYLIGAVAGLGLIAIAEIITMPEQLKRDYKYLIKGIFLIVHDYHE